MKSLAAYVMRQKSWSAKTFGEQYRTNGLLAHISKELEEIRRSPHDLEEWIDVVILALDGYWRHGGDPREIMAHLQAKQDKNFARKWNPATGDQPSEHVREGEKNV